MYKKETENSFAGSEPSSSARASNSLTTAPRFHSVLGEVNWLYQNHFFTSIDAV